MKFTFKKYIPTGRYKSFELKYTDIKLKKKVIGHISELRDSHKYRVSFAIKKEKTKKDPAPFKWVSFKKQFDTEKEARDFVNDDPQAIQDKLDLYSFED